MVAISHLCLFASFELDTGHLRELAQASMQRGHLLCVPCRRVSLSCLRRDGANSSPPEEAGTGGWLCASCLSTTGGTWVWGQMYLCNLCVCSLEDLWS